MSRRKISRGMVLGFASYGVDAIVSTLLFPLLIRYLGRAEAGTWMLFNSIAAMLACLLSGAGPVVARATAQTLAGGVVYNWSQLRQVSSTLYRQIALLCGLVAALVAGAYLPSVASRAGIGPAVILCAWGIFFLGWLLRAFSGLRFSHLDGLGEIGFNRALGTAAGLLNLFLIWPTLHVGGGLIELCAIYAAIAYLLWLSAGALLKKKIPADFWAADDGPVAAGLMGDGMKMFVLSIASYVTTQSCILLVEWQAGAEALATFAPVVRLAVLIAGAATLPATLLFPYLSRRHQEGDRAGFRRLSLVVMALPPALYAIPGCVLFIFPHEIIGAWLGEENYAGDNVVRLVVASAFFLALNSAFATPGVAIKAKSFVPEAILHMVLVGTLMPICAHFWGLLGYPLGMLAGTVVPSALVLSQSVRILSAESNQPRGLQKS